MSVKARLLELLENNRDGYISGSGIADKLSVSRGAVWKAVCSLRDEGYGVLAVTNKGYRLAPETDILSAASISRFFSKDAPFVIETHRTLASTNTLLKELASSGVTEGYVVTAEEQTGGKGRLGRSFYSPNGSGAYFSVLLRPKQTAKTASLITAAAAVAVCEAIYEITGQKAGIKWVNDVFIGGKKVCGILTEASFDMESGRISSAELGIGINVARPKDELPPELSDIVGYLSDGFAGAGRERSRLVALVLERIWEYYGGLETKAFLGEYRARSTVLGRDVLIHGAADTPRAARAVDIDDECRLIVRYESGETDTLSSGEVSITAFS